MPPCRWVLELLEVPNLCTDLAGCGLKICLINPIQLVKSRPRMLHYFTVDVVFPFVPGEYILLSPLFTAGGGLPLVYGSISMPVDSATFFALRLVDVSIWPWSRPATSGRVAA